MTTNLPTRGDDQQPGDHQPAVESGTGDLLGSRVGAVLPTWTAIELLLLCGGHDYLQCFKFVGPGYLDRKRLFELGYTNSHGWPTDKGREAATTRAATLPANLWAQKHGASSFEAYMQSEIELGPWWSRKEKS